MIVVIINQHCIVAFKHERQTPVTAYLYGPVIRLSEPNIQERRQWPPISLTVPPSVAAGSVEQRVGQCIS
jgi:hypothetical protein